MRERETETLNDSVENHYLDHLEKFQKKKKIWVDYNYFIFFSLFVIAA